MLRGLFDTSYKELKRIDKTVKKIEELADHYKTLSDDELKNMTVLFRERLNNNESLESLIPEVFATVREAATRVLHMTPLEFS